MQDILAAGVLTNNNVSALYAKKNIRTHLPPNINISVAKGIMVFRGSSVEVIAANMLMPDTECFYGCKELRSIKVYNQGESNNNAFLGCESLESLNFYGSTRRTSFSIQDSPLISMSSLEKIIKSTQSGDTAFTITLHPEVYARVTDEIFAAAAAKNITIATTG